MFAIIAHTQAQTTIICLSWYFSDLKQKKKSKQQQQQQNNKQITKIKNILDYERDLK